MFWKETLISYCDYIDIAHISLDTQHIPVCFNPQIKINKKSLFFESLYRKGFMFLSDFSIDFGEFIQLGEFGVNLPFSVVLNDNNITQAISSPTSIYEYFTIK